MHMKNECKMASRILGFLFYDLNVFKKKKKEKKRIGYPNAVDKRDGFLLPVVIADRKWERIILSNQNWKDAGLCIGHHS